MNERNVPILTAITFFLLAVVVVIQFMPQSMPVETKNDAVVEKTSDGYQLNLQAVLELAEMDSGNGTVEYRGFNFTGPQLLYIFARGL